MCARFYLELWTYVESYRKFKCLILLFKKNKIIIIKMLLHFDFFWQLKKENNLKSADFIYIDIKCSIYCPH